MGTTTQKYSLKWNDFTVNVASTFRDLHSRHDFVDVTLACSDGSTLEAHKVILSSVSSYFRDILKTTPCQHPIIILKDTGRDEASALLEFAYTGEVNVAQELLQSFLHMARSFRIKGLDKVECPVDNPPTCQQNEASSSEHWIDSASSNETYTPSGSSAHQELKASTFTEHFMASEKSSLAHRGESSRGDSGHSFISPPPSLPNSRPPTREPSPVHSLGLPPPSSVLNARTPPPKRWKRSFDLNGHKEKCNGFLLGSVPENYSKDRSDILENGKRSTMTCDSSGPRLLPYPHSMPTSPTMFERGNEIRLAGLIRHHLDLPRSSIPDHPSSSDPLDYRCFHTKDSSREEYRSTSSTSSVAAAAVAAAAATDDVRNYRMIFRPESAPTVIDMSPDGSLSGPPSVRNSDCNESRGDDEIHSNSSNNNSLMAHNSGDDLSDCVSKAFCVTPDGLGRYNCDECGKIFKHPGSLQHHRHIHRGTHRCPSCGKAFSRRWDMERHLNKSKYGCPANRFSASGDPESPGGHGGSHGGGLLMSASNL